MVIAAAGFFTQVFTVSSGWNFEFIMNEYYDYGVEKNLNAENVRAALWCVIMSNLALCGKFI